MALNSKVYRNSAIYAACNFALKAINFLLLPLYTAFLSTADYGIMGLMDRFTAVATVLSTFSLQAAVMRFYIDYRDDKEGLPRFVGTLICFATLSTLLFNILFVSFRRILVPTLFSSIPFEPTVIITLSSLFFTNIYGIYQQILRGMEKAKLSAITSIVYLLLNIAFTVLFVVGFGMGANGSLLGTAMAGLCLSIFAVGHMIRIGAFTICINWSLVREMLKYSIPIMPHNLATQIAQLISGVLINSGGSLMAVGLYNVASKFGQACDTLQSSVSTAYQPWLFRMLKDKPADYKGQIVAFSTTLLDIYTLVFVGIGLFIREPILLFIDKSYADSWMLVPPIVLVYAAKSSYYFYIAILFYYKEAANKIFIATLSSSLLNVMLTFLFVPSMGSYGSVLADGLSMILRVGIVIYMSLSYDDAGYKIRQFMLPFLMTVASLTIGLFPSYIDRYSINLRLIVWRVLVYSITIIIIFAKHNTLLKEIVKKLGRS